MIIMGLQASTQWDGLAHVGYDGFFYNGVPAGAVNNFQGAIEERHRQGGREAHLPRRAARHRRAEGGRRAARLLRDHRRRRAGGRGAPGGAGRVRRHLCIRTGWYKYFAEGDRQHYVGNTAGPGLDICRWIHDREIAALALDQSNGECWPTPMPGATIPFHQVMIRDIGLTLGEMFDFNDAGGRLRAGRRVGVLLLRHRPQGHRGGRHAAQPGRDQVGGADDHLRRGVRGRLHHRSPRTRSTRTRATPTRIMALYTPDAVLEVPGMGVFEGADAIRACLGQVEAQGAAAPHAGQRRDHRLGRRGGPRDHRRGVHRPGRRRAGRFRSSPATRTCSARSTASGCSAAGRTSTSAGSRRAEPGRPSQNVRGAAPTRPLARDQS